jgi:quercetin dioxygenase-like cupin family protein
MGADFAVCGRSLKVRQCHLRSAFVQHRDGSDCRSELDQRRQIVTADDAQPVFIPALSGKVLDFLGATHKLTSQQTGGACCMFESTFDPETGNRLHVHGREDEIAYVLDGALEVRIQGQTRSLDIGGIARLPKGLPHAIRNPLKTPSRYLFIAVPGGLDLWFDAVTDAKRDGLLDDAMFGKLSLDFDIGWFE